MRKKGKIVLVIWAVLMTVTTMGLLGIEVIRLTGRKKLTSKSVTAAPVMQSASVTNSSVSADWEPDWVKYNGEAYQYNEDITTFLVMGIDKSDLVVKQMPEGMDGGQADALFLLVLNPHDQSIKVIGINRNTMTDIDVYDDKGNYTTSIIAQIAIEHGFGDGLEESCEYQVKAVSNLFYQLPIHGYAAINMSAIPTINDSVGGVDVLVLDDLSKYDKTLVKGQTVHLEGEHAYNYVRERDTSQFGSADKRFQRQYQYIDSFIAKLREQSQDDSSVALNLYNAISDMMVTNISAEEVSYLAPTLNGYSFNADDFIQLKGETKMGDQFEEYYVDDDALYDTIINVFYEKVDHAN